MDKAVCVGDLERIAEGVMDKGDWDYVQGGAEDEVRYVMHTRTRIRQ